MGFGCNAAGIIACRIIESPRERLIAILTNNFVPCNGRFPTMIAMAAVFMGVLVSDYNSLAASALVAGMVVLGVFVTLAVSWLLSKTLLQGVPSTFTLELPPYRIPKIGPLLIRSVLDRTLFVLMRAVVVAAPAGAVTWLLANIQVGDLSILAHLAGWLQGFGHSIGLDGYIILAFLLGLPANEIVLPILIMSYLAQGALMELDSIDALRELLVQNGWTWLTALNMILFSLLHFPCATTLLTIRKETQSAKWTVLAALIPTGIAIIVCFVVAQLARALGLV
jgi:ferrous iron transport protein B